MCTKAVFSPKAGNMAGCVMGLQSKYENVIQIPKIQYDACLSPYFQKAETSRSPQHTIPGNGWAQAQWEAVSTQ